MRGKPASSGLRVNLYAVAPGMPDRPVNRLFLNIGLVNMKSSASIVQRDDRIAEGMRRLELGMCDRRPDQDLPAVLVDEGEEPVEALLQKNGIDGDEQDLPAQRSAEWFCSDLNAPGDGWAPRPGPSSILCDNRRSQLDKGAPSFREACAVRIAAIQ